MGWMVTVTEVVRYAAICGEFRRPDGDRSPGGCQWLGPERDSEHEAAADATAHRKEHEAGWAAYNERMRSGHV